MISYLQLKKNRKKPNSIFMLLPSIFLFFSSSCSKHERHACDELLSPITIEDNLSIAPKSKKADSLVSEFCYEFKDQMLLFNSSYKAKLEPLKDRDWSVPSSVVRKAPSHKTFMNLECYLSIGDELVVELPNSEFNHCDNGLPEKNLLYYSDYWRFKALTPQTITVFNRKHNFMRTMHVEANANLRKDLLSLVKDLSRNRNDMQMREIFILSISKNFFDASPIQQELLSILRNDM